MWRSERRPPMCRCSRLISALSKNSRSAPSQRISEPKRSRSSIMRGGSPAVEGEFQRGRCGSLVSPFARIKAKFLSCSRAEGNSGDDAPVARCVWTPPISRRLHTREGVERLAVISEGVLCPLWPDGVLAVAKAFRRIELGVVTGERHPKNFSRQRRCSLTGRMASRGFTPHRCFEVTSRTEPFKSARCCDGSVLHLQAGAARRCKRVAHAFLPQAHQRRQLIGQEACTFVQSATPSGGQERPVNVGRRRTANFIRAHGRTNCINQALNVFQRAGVAIKCRRESEVSVRVQACELLVARQIKKFDGGGLFPKSFPRNVMEAIQGQIGQAQSAVKANHRFVDGLFIEAKGGTSLTLPHDKLADVDGLEVFIGFAELLQTIVVILFHVSTVQRMADCRDPFIKIPRLLQGKSDVPRPFNAKV